MKNIVQNLFDFILAALVSIIVSIMMIVSGVIMLVAELAP